MRSSSICLNQNRAFSMALEFSAPPNLVKLLPSLVKSSLKSSQQVYATYEKKGLKDLLLFQTLAGVKLPFSAQSITLFKKEKEHRGIFESKTSTFSTKIESGLVYSSHALFRGDTKSTQNTLNEVLKIIHKELLKSKREKTKSLLRKQLENALTWLGWSAYFSGHPQKAKVYFEEAAQKGEAAFNLLLDYGLFLVKEGVSYASKIYDPQNSKFLQLLKFIHQQGKQLQGDLETLSQVFQQCPAQYKDLLFLATVKETGREEDKIKLLLSKCESILYSFNPSLTSYFYLKGSKGERQQKIRNALVERKEDNILLLYQFVKQQIRDKTKAEETLFILDQLENLFGGAGLSIHNLRFWKGRYFEQDHRHRLASRMFSEAFEGVSDKKKLYIKSHQGEFARLQQIIKIAALNRDTIRKSAPAFSDLEPFWQELLKLCLNKIRDNESFQLFYQKYPNRFEASFLLWFSLLKSKDMNSLNRARTLLSEMASSSSSYDQDFLQVDDALLFRLIGKNYADELSREQFLAIMDLKTTIKEKDINLARSCVSHLLSFSNLPILHYFALSIAQKQAKVNPQTLNLQTLERVRYSMNQHFLKTQDWSDIYHRAKSALLWSQILYLSKEEQGLQLSRGWRVPYKRARDLLVAQTKEGVLRSESRAIDYQAHKYKL